jgi:hypothetical protein
MGVAKGGIGAPVGFKRLDCQPVDDIDQIRWGVVAGLLDASDDVFQRRVIALQLFTRADLAEGFFDMVRAIHQTRGMA